MRNHPLRRLSLRAYVVVALWSSLAGLTTLGSRPVSAADGGMLAVEIDVPDTLVKQAHASVTVRVDLPAGVPDDTPLLLTPTVEGSAVEVLRGRLFRGDAEATSPSQLRFQVPVIARSEGTAILRIDVSTYACKKRCTAITASAQKSLRVEAR